MAYTPESLRYPLAMLEKTTDYLKINVVDYKKIGLNKVDTTNVQIPRSGQNVDPTDPRFSASLTRFSLIRERGQLYNKNIAETTTNTVFLPIPSNIQDGNSVSFGEGNLDGLTASVLDYAKDLIKGPESITNLQDISNFITNALRGGVNVLLQPEALDYFNNTIASAAANIPFGGNLTASQLLARQTGNILNPNMELFFNGVTLRSFKFSFKMTPRNHKEAEQIKKIIRLFKKNMSPSTEGSFYLKTPKIFQLFYMKGNEKHPFLHKFKQCALTDMSVNYTGEGTYATYGGANNKGGGTPVSMIMDLGFKELEPIYADDYNSEDGKLGVGF
jgi:hypothetical protein